MVERLAGELDDHAPAGPAEREDLEAMRAFAEAKDEPFDRTDLEGHFVASGIVASPTLDRVVLLHHTQLEMWLQPGGHAERDENRGRAIARREVREETNLDVDEHPAWSGLLDVDVHKIPATETMPEHRHLDLRYLFQADPEAVPTAPADEAGKVRWFDVEVARRKLDLDEGLERALWKVHSLRVEAGYEGETTELPGEG